MARLQVGLLAAHAAWVGLGPWLQGRHAVTHATRNPNGCRLLAACTEAPGKSPSTTAATPRDRSRAGSSGGGTLLLSGSASVTPSGSSTGPASKSGMLGMVSLPSTLAPKCAWAHTHTHIQTHTSNGVWQQTQAVRAAMSRAKCLLMKQDAGI